MKALIDAERIHTIVTEDETLAALIAAGTPGAPFEELARRVYDDALELLSASQSQAALARAIALGEAAIAEVAEQRRRLRVVAPELACARGCSSCCVLRVEIGPLEAARLAPFVDELGVRAEVERLAREVGSLDRRERLAARRSCALLGPDGACRVHAARPLACRAANSLSRAACESAAAEADTSVRIPVDGAPLGLMRAAALGLSLACADAGLDAARKELHRALAEFGP